MNDLAGRWKLQGCRVMVMKGQANGAFYPRPDHRSPGDIDCYLYDDYAKGNMDFILQCFTTVMKMEDIVDLNGAGDAFLGGFLSQFMQGKNLEACCKAGNDAANVILKNIGCTFDKRKKIQFS